MFDAGDVITVDFPGVTGIKVVSILPLRERLRLAVIIFLDICSDRLKALIEPTLSICTLVNGEYEIEQLRGNQIVFSPTFPGLKLTAEQVLRAGG